MPSIIIPTVDALSGYKASPAQLVKDQEAENYMVNVDNYKFLRKLSQTIAAGQTSFTYSTTLGNANNIKKYLTGAEYKYNFAEGTNITITPSSGQPEDSVTLTFQWTYSS